MSAIVLLALGCAVPKAPTGGPKDTIAPKLLSTYPPQGACSIRPKTVWFAFDEYIDPGAAAQAVFISPPFPPDAAPQIYVAGKRLCIRFKEPLRNNTTYSISVSKTLTDVTERNPLVAPLQLAFSTGSVLDSARIVGKIVSSTGARLPKSMLVFAVSPDSLAAGVLLNLQPAYATQADDNGCFSLDYLTTGPWVVCATNDADRNFRYNLPSEYLAVSKSLLPAVARSRPQPTDSVILAVSIPDAQPPRVVRMEVESPEQVVVRFSEPVDPEEITAQFAGENLRVQPLADRKVVRLVLSSPVRANDSLRIQLQSLCDTVANCADTLVAFRVPRRLTDRFRLDVAPDTAQRVRGALRLWASARLTDAPLARLDTAIAWLDSTNRRYPPARLEVQGRTLTVHWPTGLDSTRKLRLRVDTLLRSASGFRLDSVRFWNRPYTMPPPLATLRLEVNTTLEHFLLMLTHSTTGIVLRTDRRKQTFPNVPTGTYKVQLLDDADANGAYTPARLQPLQPPETLIAFPEPLELKAQPPTQAFEIAY